MLTDERGNYEFETVMPGRYPVPPNLPGLEKYAGLHAGAIHFRPAESIHTPLTTQLYFKDDPYIAKDPWASRKPSLVIDLKQDGKTLHGTFDIALARGFSVAPPVAVRFSPLADIEFALMRKATDPPTHWPYAAAPIEIQCDLAARP